MNFTSGTNQVFTVKIGEGFPCASGRGKGKGTIFGACSDLSVLLNMTCRQENYFTRT